MLRKRKLKANKETSSKEGSSPEGRVETEEFFDIIEDLEWDSSADFEESYIEGYLFNAENVFCLKKSSI